MDRARAEDPRMQELGAVLSHWNTVIGQDAVTVKQLIERATESYATVPGGIDTNKREFMNPNFREALLIVAGEGGAINSRRLGNWLGKNKGKVVDKLRLEPATMQSGDNRWQARSSELPVRA
jgi:hypothetical protein